jgi:hypothetical protein
MRTLLSGIEDESISQSAIRLCARLIDPRIPDQLVSPPRHVLCAHRCAPLSRRCSLQEGKDEGVATLTASADSSIFLRVSAELALPLGRNRHLVN